MAENAPQSSARTSARQEHEFWDRQFDDRRPDDRRPDRPHWTPSAIRPRPPRDGLATAMDRSAPRPADRRPGRGRAPRRRGDHRRCDLVPHRSGRRRRRRDRRPSSRARASRRPPRPTRRRFADNVRPGRPPRSKIGASRCTSPARWYIRAWSSSRRVAGDRRARGRRRRAARRRSRPPQPRGEARRRATRVRRQGRAGRPR